MECRDGSLICDRCFGRLRGLLADLTDLIARVRSIIDPLKANPLDQLRVRITATDVPAAVPSDPLDALLTLAEVQGVWWSWREDLTAISNNLEVVTWLGGAVLDRHPAVDGVRPAWSVQDAVDQWGVERRVDSFIYPDDETGEEVVGPVREWYDPTLTVKQAAERVGLTQRAVLKWVDGGVLVPRMKVRGPRGSVTSVFYASEVDAAAELMKSRRVTVGRVPQSGVD